MAAPWQLLLLLGCCLLAGVQPGRAAHVAAGGSAGRRLQQATPAAEEVAAPDAVDGAPAAEGSCQAALNYSSVFMPPSAQLQFRLFVNGTRNYTCSTFTLQFGPAMALSRATGDFACVGYYASPFVGYVDCSDPATGLPVGKVTLDTTVPGAVFVAPSPDAASEPWGRFKVTTDGALPPANYIVRYNSTGGQRPAQCTAPRGEWVLVPFSAVTDYYWCP